MRIVQIIPEMGGDEPARGTLELAQELVRLGHESIVISNGGELVSRLTLRGSRHIQMPLHRKSLWSLRLVGRLRRTLLELRPDVVQVRSPMPAWIARLAWKGMPEGERPRLVTAVHGLDSRGVYGGAVASGERVIAVSQWVADDLQKNFARKLNAPPRVIPRGVNTREFDRQAPVSGHWQLRLLNDYPQLEGKHWLLMPAALAPDQGQRTFLEMLASIARRRDDVFGLVVGSAGRGGEKYARGLERLALDLGLQEKVLFLGERRDMRELYASSRICYHLSAHPEPAGRIVAEALAMNCPAVAYRDGGPGEVLERCFPQGLVERGSVEALAETSLEILERPQPIDFAGFSLEDTAAQTLALYDELCQLA